MEKQEGPEQPGTEAEIVHKPDYSAKGISLRVALFIFINLLVQLFAFLGGGDRDGIIGNDSKLKILQTVGAIAVLIQIVVFIPCFIFQTEKYYDLTGSLTYITCILYSFFAGKSAANGDFTLRAAIVTGLILIWCTRLGFFLFRRVLKAGKDGRFDVFKVDFFRFLNVWAIQGLWVFLTAYAAFVINADQRVENPDIVATDILGIVIWAVGFVIEVVADYQKDFWREKPNKRFPFIDYGLWYYSRHPNYFGEMVLWVGIFVLSIEVLDGTQFAVIISPIFVFCLINFLSGVPILEKRSDEKFGHLQEYWDYKQNTSSLIPLPKGVCGAKISLPIEELPNEQLAKEQGA